MALGVDPETCFTAPVPADPESPDLPIPPIAAPVGADAVATQAGESRTVHGAIHSHCENCGAELHGPFCHACGQHDFEFHRSFRHVFLDALENFFHFDAKLFRNLITLQFHPGRLSADFNAGKRAAQMPPFRLYIFVSFLFFFLIFIGDSRPTNFAQRDEPGQPKVTFREDGRPATMEETMTAEQKESAVPTQSGSMVDRLRPAAGQIKTDAEANKNSAASSAPTKSGVASGQEPKSKLSQWIEHQADRAQDPAGQRALVDAFLHSLPKMLLFCLPFFALYTCLLFRKSGLVYLQHLVIALHFHTFIYFWVMCRDGWALLARLPGIGLHGWVLFVCNVWLALYPLLMLRRLFANSWKLTLFKTAVLAVAYFSTLVLALGVTALIVVALL